MEQMSEFGLIGFIKERIKMLSQEFEQTLWLSGMNIWCSYTFSEDEMFVQFLDQCKNPQSILEYFSCRQLLWPSFNTLAKEMAIKRENQDVIASNSFLPMTNTATEYYYESTAF